jgi:hypothetical protein
VKKLIVLAVFAGLLTTAGIGCDSKKTTGGAGGTSATKVSTTETKVSSESKGSGAATK